MKEKTYFRMVFVGLSLFSIGIILWNTYAFFNQLKESERQKMEIWAAAQAEVLQNRDLDKAVAQLTVNIIRSNTDTPMILYSHLDRSYDLRNLPNENLSEAQIERYVKRFSGEYAPIEVTHDDEVLSTIYYGNSSLINKLKYYPAAILVIILLFVGLLYFFYRTQRVSEQNKLWAGMAKETAHQIGTPLSSLVGWMEILRAENTPEQHIAEMEKDLTRLQTITDRFSKIGSLPNLKKTDVVAETLAAFDYLAARSSKLITFENSLPDTPVFVELNRQLYAWAIENLVKNAVDAMKGKGVVSVAVQPNTHWVHILISDTGSGIASRDFKSIFKPGFTTKKRGWGLGLSLTRRIIEDYHNGKIKVKQSEPGKGTSFQISLRLV